jgi:hypothetical protein
MGTAGDEISHRPAEAIVQAGDDGVTHVVVSGHQFAQASLCTVAPASQIPSVGFQAIPAVNAKSHHTLTRPRNRS